MKVLPRWQSKAAKEKVWIPQPLLASVKMKARWKEAKFKPRVTKND